MKDDFSQVAAIVRQSRSSFYWGMRLLPRAKREAMFAVYAYCRILDDIADEPAAPEEKLRLLAGWRSEVAALYDGHPSQPVSRLLARALPRFGLERAELEALIDGMEMDVRGCMRGPSRDELGLYCRRVAGAVGLLSVRIFGCPEPQARRFAEVLGEALQLTNILRDLKEDAVLGRLYLPTEALDQAGITIRDPAAVLDHPALPQACEAVAQEAEALFDQAAMLLQDCNRRRLRPAVVMMATYRRLLERLRQRGWQSIEKRERLPRLERLWIVLRHTLPLAR
ncbi:presqualene diphosphate synthase HpnD [Telmatospirillum sp. J64-1]|uniref:presqualene diphosphate synthase HpnD n=1 Tax=Telmatospirillum sp. J64-1 TaxID=2502183 RepID=UPI00115D2BF2|nr:presqualene diphosphate synthase HpnD [Telmatospirillum sp. J64-1]